MRNLALRLARRFPRSGHGRGQAVPEFALILPLFMAMTIGVIDMGRVVWSADITANAAREAARFAIVHGGSPGTSCPVGPPSAEANVPNPSSSCPFPSPSTQAIKDAARNAAVGAGSQVTVTVCYGQECSGDTHTLGTNARGTPVTVVVTAQVPLLSSALLGLTGYTISGSSTMLVAN